MSAKETERPYRTIRHRACHVSHRRRWAAHNVRGSALTVGDIIDCEGCGLRYSRRVVPMPEHQANEHRCTCGHVLGDWEGAFRLDFEPEDGEWS